MAKPFHYKMRNATHHNKDNDCRNDLCDKITPVIFAIVCSKTSIRLPCSLFRMFYAATKFAALSRSPQRLYLPNLPHRPHRHICLIGRIDHIGHVRRIEREFYHLYSVCLYYLRFIVDSQSSNQRYYGKIEKLERSLPIRAPRHFGVVSR